MHKGYLYIVLGLFILFLFGGCATTPIGQGSISSSSILEVQIKNKDAQIANLSTALEDERRQKQLLLETIAERDEEIKQLTSVLQKKKRTIADSSKSREYYFFVIAIQVALRNAGFQPGLIDGRVGERTQAALKNFQSANGLPADGRIDKQTWELLRNYL
jgi:murein L,D-transpeptidase YcbB/YkuD